MLYQKWVGEEMVRRRNPTGVQQLSSEKASALINFTPSRMSLAPTRKLVQAGCPQSAASTRHQLASQGGPQTSFAPIRPSCRPTPDVVGTGNRLDAERGGVQLGSSPFDGPSQPSVRNSPRRSYIPRRFGFCEAQVGLLPAAWIPWRG